MVYPDCTLLRCQLAPCALMVLFGPVWPTCAPAEQALLSIYQVTLVVGDVTKKAGASLAVDADITENAGPRLATGLNTDRNNERSTCALCWRRSPV